jgi:hypothetical protein
MAESSIPTGSVMKKYIVELDWIGLINQSLIQLPLHVFTLDLRKYDVHTA